MLNSLNTHYGEHTSSGSSVDTNTDGLGNNVDRRNTIDGHYGKLSLDTESAIILQSFKRQNY